MTDSGGQNTAQKTVLLVVNQADDRAMFTDLMHKLGLAVVDVASGAEAIRVVEDCAVDLLVMDIHTPDMHGWQLLAKVREIDRLRQLPVVVIADPNATTPIASKPIVYILRPVSIAHLRKSIVSVLGLGSAV